MSRKYFIINLVKHLIKEHKYLDYTLYNQNKTLIS